MKKGVLSHIKSPSNLQSYLIMTHEWLKLTSLLLFFIFNFGFKRLQKDTGYKKTTVPCLIMQWCSCFVLCYKCNAPSHLQHHHPSPKAHSHLISACVAFAKQIQYRMSWSRHVWQGGQWCRCTISLFLFFFHWNIWILSGNPLAKIPFFEIQ